MKEKMELPLGKESTYGDQYDSTLIASIPRSFGRSEINAPAALPFNGVDLWNCYEVSWLNMKGKPCVRIVMFSVPSTSEFIVESKSIKLYLNSLNGTKFESEAKVLNLMTTDLSKAANGDVSVSMPGMNSFSGAKLEQFDGINIDDLDVEITDYDVNSELLKLDSKNNIIEETLTSNLLKSNCLVTNQPDWASVQIKYKGAKIDHKSLLKYIISFRNHNEFHEQCVEHMFLDIMQKCSPEELTIYAKYTRRGGVDINPYRTSLPLEEAKINRARDIRQ